MSITRLPPEWRVKQANPDVPRLAAVANDAVDLEGVRITGTCAADGPRAWIESDTTTSLVDPVDEPVKRNDGA